MSIEYYCYTSKRDPYKLEDITRLMKTMNWEIRFLNESDEKLYSGEILSEDCSVVGWESCCERHSELEDIEDFSDKDLNSFYEDESLGYITLYVEPDYSISDELTEDEIEEFKEDLESDVFEKINSASFYASTRTAAGRNERSHELQYFLLYALCLIDGGVLEDEMQGEFLSLEKAEVMPSREEMGF